MIHNNLHRIGGRVLDVLLTINLAPGGVVFIVDEAGTLLDVMDAQRIRESLAGEYGVDSLLERIIDDKYPYVDEHGVIKGDSDRFERLPVVDASHKVTGFYETGVHKSIPVAKPMLGMQEFGYLVEAFLSGWISSSGHYVGLFEKLFADYCGATHGIATANGTVALHLALTALDIGPGDEVIVPDLTFAATINAVLYTGATPVIVDIDDSWCMDPNAVRAAITSRTRVIIPVHLYGQPCDMDSLLALAKEYGLAVVEDCAEAHGAEFAGRKVGSMGDIGCFSFFGNKIVTTGEGGMCITSSPELKDKMRLLRDHGMNTNKLYTHEVIGFNYRMTNLQAAVGVAQVEKISYMLNERFAVESAYRNCMASIREIEFQRDFAGRKRVVWLMSILVSASQKNDLIKSMRKYGIDFRPFFCPLSQMDIYRNYAHSCKCSSEIASRGINLPTFSGVDVEVIVEKLNLELQKHKS